jgi:hypothetical protein
MTPQQLRRVLTELENEVVDVDYKDAARKSSAYLSKEDVKSSSVTETLRRAMALASHSDNSSNAPDVVVVCGTSFIMGEARAALGIVEPRDSDELNQHLIVSGTSDSKTVS